ncbi:hypothetical protein L486_05632 [Kwoniella mangroviensis CBS 10435]|uniref:Uncharacterized protein n=1 Tax=Kwoniella mangroviensis CBS 10435 TaxID=1331196 RepID=A0A1B9IMM7_9TREE|nr:hypothetical protein L486_05632 [Kwoniella mangroviensis CBS 10435]
MLSQILARSIMHRPGQNKHSKFRKEARKEVRILTANPGNRKPDDGKVNDRDVIRNPERRNRKFRMDIRITWIRMDSRNVHVWECAELRSRARQMEFVVNCDLAIVISLQVANLFVWLVKDEGVDIKAGG